MLNTELPSQEHAGLDQYPVADLVDTLIADQFNAVRAVHNAAATITAAIEAAAPRIAAGGRLIYVGAGTSGRLGVLDGVELHPTFSWPHERALSLLAGGKGAMFKAVEGAEDDREQGGIDLLALQPESNDVILLLAASGTTPYVLGALAAANASGALTIGIANNPGAPVVAGAHIGITLDTGHEVISGSTRLKAGTAQKIVLNTISSAIMVRLHKVYGNLMVDMRPTNAKLVQRAIALTVHATGADPAVARQTLEQCGFHVKVAVVALLRRQPVAQAQALLARSKGSVRAALLLE
jgi:N-acetylmuramic acid 6-phosphate etherase